MYPNLDRDERFGLATPGVVINPSACSRQVAHPSVWLPLLLSACLLLWLSLHALLEVVFHVPLQHKCPIGY